METMPREEARRFGTGLERETAGLRAFLRRRLGTDSASVEDALQETLLRAWRYRSAFEDGRALGPWLLTIAARVVHGRRTPDLVDGEDPVDERGLGPLQAAVLGEERQRLVEALASLQAVAREIFDAFYGQQLSVAEIAVRTALPVGTVKSHLHRARARLRSVLAAGGEGRHSEDES